MKKLDQLTYKLAENCLSKNSTTEARLILNWDKIFSKYSNMIRPKKIKFPHKKNNKGTLILNVKRGFELEIQMEQIKILHLANNFIGYRALEKIMIVKNGFN